VLFSMKQAAARRPTTTKYCKNIHSLYVVILNGTVKRSILVDDVQ
jgi:hypothetical protein